MIEVLETENAILKKNETENSARAFDGCVIEIPKDFAVANNLPEKSFVALTVQNGKIEAQFFVTMTQDENEVDLFLNNFVDLDAEMKKIGD